MPLLSNFEIADISQINLFDGFLLVTQRFTRAVLVESWGVTQYKNDQFENHKFKNTQGQLCFLNFPFGNFFLKKQKWVTSPILTLVSILMAARLTGYSAVCMMGLRTRMHCSELMAVARVAALSSAARTTSFSGSLCASSSLMMVSSAYPRNLSGWCRKISRNTLNANARMWPWSGNRSCKCREK